MTSRTLNHTFTTWRLTHMRFTWEKYCTKQKFILGYSMEFFFVFFFRFALFLFFFFFQKIKKTLTLLLGTFSLHHFFAFMVSSRKNSEKANELILKKAVNWQSYTWQTHFLTNLEVQRGSKIYTCRRLLNHWYKLQKSWHFNVTSTRKLIDLHCRIIDFNV